MFRLDMRRSRRMATLAVATCFARQVHIEEQTPSMAATAVAATAVATVGVAKVAGGKVAA